MRKKQTSKNKRRLTGEVTSWTKCLSVSLLVSGYFSRLTIEIMHTDIEQNSAIKSLIDDMILKDLVVESSRRTFSSRHDGWGSRTASRGVEEWQGRAQLKEEMSERGRTIEPKSLRMRIEDEGKGEVEVLKMCILFLLPRMRGVATYSEQNDPSDDGGRWSDAWRGLELTKGCISKRPIGHDAFAGTRES